MKFETTDIVKIQTTDHTGHKATRLLAPQSESSRFLVGEEVDREGARTGRIHVIDVTTVTRRIPMQWNLHYGRLEVTKPRV